MNRNNGLWRRKPHITAPGFKQHQGDKKACILVKPRQFGSGSELTERASLPYSKHANLSHSPTGKP